MKAMILAAGIGSRLGEITKSLPKCLVTVNGKTLLEHAVDRLKQVGVNFIVINTHHLASQVEEFVCKNNSFGITIHLSHEDSLLETGGGVYKAKEYFLDQAEFIVHNADVYHHLDLAALVVAHKNYASLATLLVMSRQTKRYLVFDDNSSLIGRVNSVGEVSLIQDSTVQNLLAFSGIQIISPRIFDYCESLAPRFSIIDAYLNAVKLGGTVKGYLSNLADWSDVGTPERLQELNARLGDHVVDGVAVEGVAELRPPGPPRK
jgi:NDP-sugar pyrophosphorylase family protein